MDACVGVKKEVDKVISKINEWNKTKNEDLDGHISRVQEIIEKLKQHEDEEKLNPVEIYVIRIALINIKKFITQIASQHRDLHSSVSKVGKTIDRNFISDFNSVSQEEFFSEESKTRFLHQVILEHFYRQGRLEISDILSKEAQINEYQALKEPFFDLNSILESLRNKDSGPALTWAFTLRSEWNARLRLHRLRFIEMLRSGKRLEAIKYARQHFPQFVDGHEKEIQCLMGACMYPNIAESPYAHLLSPSLWTDACDHFVREACALMGVSVESPLSVVINAGSQALPALLNIKQVMLHRQVSGTLWNAKDELPIEIDLGNNCRFSFRFCLSHSETANVRFKSST
ncbi:RMND5 [Lepeophtheirus salmonis]|uniref:RMND5 n=1 Tax=Lepeophtheirus salmonis TaxID=72036 RepID=A0A7R8CFS6_LEPSM|nr:RMND5 [Lepeophtheirus salmonis]CAF2768773.1 RMND5 [Lepeophtheirus salmonis]